MAPPEADTRELNKDIEELIRTTRHKKSPTPHRTHTPTHTHRQSTPTFKVKRAVSRSLTVGYANIQRSGPFTETTLETCKDLDLVFIGEPCIYQAPGTSLTGTPLSPNFHLSIPGHSSKILAFCNKRLAHDIHSCTSPLGNAIRIQVRGTHIRGGYLPGKDLIKNLQNNVHFVWTDSHDLVIGDFNPHVAGAKINDIGKALLAWTESNRLTQEVSTIAITWKKGNKERLLNLVFTNRR